MTWQGAFAIAQFATSVLIPFLGNQLGGLLGAFKAIGAIALITAVAALLAKQIWGHRAYQRAPS